MTWWPGWDSVASAGYWSHFWFWFGIVCLFALGASEVVSHMYGLRKDELVAVAESNAAAQRQNDAEAAETRRKADVETLQKKLADAERATAEAAKKASQVQTQQADRRLSDEQKRVILAAISPYPGQQIDLVAVMNDGEAIQFAEDFLAIFRAAKWGTGGVNQAAYVNGSPIGIVAIISAAHGAAGTAPIGAGKLMIALMQLGLIKGGLSDQSVQGETLRLIVGRKPPL
jgi:hypothetical protein